MTAGQRFDRSYPKGRINADDEGQVSVGIALDPSSNRIIINYFKPIKWVGLDKDAALQMIQTIAKFLTTMTGEVVTISIGADKPSD
jgi:hypothetical protein